MNATRILIHRVLCDDLHDYVDLPEGLGEFEGARLHMGLLQGIETRLTYPVYSLAQYDEAERLSSWTSLDHVKGLTMSEAIVCICRHHYGQAAGQYAGEAMREMANPTGKLTVGERGTW